MRWKNRSGVDGPPLSIVGAQSLPSCAAFGVLTAIDVPTPTVATSGSRRSVRWCQRGAQTRQQQIEAAVELRRAVVVSKSRCQRAHVGELGHRQPVQAEAQD